MSEWSVAGVGAKLPPNMLVIANRIDDITTLDPAESFEFAGSDVLRNVYMKLVNFDPLDLEAAISQSNEPVRPTKPRPRRIIRFGAGIFAPRSINTGVCVGKKNSRWRIRMAKIGVIIVDHGSRRQESNAG